MSLSRLVPSQSSRSLLWTLFALEMDVDYLLMAKPVATNHLGIRRDYANPITDMLVAGSSL